MRILKRKKTKSDLVFYKARDEGIEPPLEVLETPVLPLYESRKNFGGN